MTDKKIKMLINEALKEPNVSFDEWAEKHDVEINNRQAVQVPAPALEAEISINNNGTLCRNKKVRFITSTFAVTSLLIVAVVILFMFLLPKGVGPSVPIIKEYGTNDVDRIVMTPNEYIALEDVDKIDLTKAEDVMSINQIIAKDNSILVLGYAVEKIIYGIVADDGLYAYKFDSFARIYEKYFFENADEFENLEQEYIFKEQKYYYKVSSKVEGIMAYISYEKNDISYYFTVKAFEDLCEINENSIKIFIENIIN